ncbi:MAG TPA: hypothetical protein VFL65_01170 [Jatrophihabitans sp.]|nr:hypothetical protein [Jatrophihabitans sp.]
MSETATAEPAHVPRPDREYGDPDWRSEFAIAVVRAVRLGWYVAEVRGRLWWRGPRPAAQPMPPDAGRPLPLRPQRSAAESRQQAFDALVCLSAALEVTTLPELDGPPQPPFPVRLRELITELDLVAGEPADQQDRTWRPIAELLYAWDAAIQDQLTARADVLACAYLLGRGLAECYWALGPDDAQLCADGKTPAGGSWVFLLSSARRAELTRMVGRIGPYLNPLTPVAVSGSLEAWGSVAADPAWRADPSAADALYEQTRRWYQLLVLGQDPSTLVAPAALLHGWRTTLRLVRAFLPQLLFGLLSLGFVAAFLLLLTSDDGGTVVKTLLAIVGTVGLSATALVATVKNATQSMLARIRKSAYSDLVAIGTTFVPPHPDDAKRSPGRRLATRREVERAVGARELAVPLRPA